MGCWQVQEHSPIPTGPAMVMSLRLRGRPGSHIRPLLSCVASNKPLTGSQTQFPHLENNCESQLWGWDQISLKARSNCKLLYNNVRSDKNKNGTSRLKGGISSLL